MKEILLVWWETLRFAAVAIPLIIIYRTSTFLRTANLQRLGVWINPRIPIFHGVLLTCIETTLLTLLTKPLWTFPIYFSVPLFLFLYALLISIERQFVIVVQELANKRASKYLDF